MKLNLAKFKLTFFLALCATIPGGCFVVPELAQMGEINTTVAQYDDEYSINMFPAHLGKGVDLGLKYIPDVGDLYLIVKVSEIKNVESLGINIDGNKNEFEAVRKTYFGEGGLYGSYSENKFLISKQLLENMLSGKRVIVRVRTSKGYIDNDFKQNCLFAKSKNSPYASVGLTLVCPVFEKFINEHMNG